MAGTRAPAEFLGGASEFGVVAEGYRADLLLVDANPLKDITNSRRISGVCVRGKWLDRDALDELLSDILARQN